MGDWNAPGTYAFGTLFTKSVPHILEKIFLFLDYESFKTCLEVSKVWRELLKSESFKKRAKYVYHEEIINDEGHLWLECYKSDIHQVKRIISTGLVEVNSFLLVNAASQYNIPMVKALLDGGADPNTANEDGNTSLSMVIKNVLWISRDKSTEIIKFLIACGADVNKADNKGWTPLHVAANYADQDIYNVLLDGGANPNVTDKVGRTPMSYYGQFSPIDT